MHAKHESITMNDNFPKGAVGMKLAWDHVLTQVGREAVVRGNQKDTITVTLSVCTSFLHDNGYEVEELVDTDFMDALACAVAAGDLAQDPTIVLPPGASGDTA